MNPKLIKSAITCACIAFTSSAVAADLDPKSFEKALDVYLQKESNVEKLSNAITAYFTKKREEQAKAANQAESQRLEEQFKNPVKVEVGNSPSKGAKNAKVTVVEFSDFQCPFCSKGKDIVDQLLKLYPNDVKVVFKNLPLDFHPEALPAAKAAMAAGKQGKFWEMHDYLFDNQKSLKSDFYPEAAKKLNLDVAKFNTDMGSKEIEDAVKADLEQAKSLGVQGTPNFYVNGVNLRGAYPIEEFQKIVDRWLSKK